MGRRMNEDELINSFDAALKDGSIFAVYQPQINHATGRMIGAEALMRWKDPEYGMQYPSDFIPVLEENDLIYKADLRIFELVCLLQKKCLEEGITPVPISFNVSRHDWAARRVLRVRQASAGPSPAWAVPRVSGEGRVWTWVWRRASWAAVPTGLRRH